MGLSNYYESNHVPTILVLLTVVLFSVAYTFQEAASTKIARDCRKLHKFTHNEQVYNCYPEEESK